MTLMANKSYSEPDQLCSALGTDHFQQIVGPFVIHADYLLGSL